VERADLIRHYIQQGSREREIDSFHKNAKHTRVVYLVFRFSSIAIIDNCRIVALVFSEVFALKGGVIANGAIG
jgi:hypothetical protein